jgi:hypothetical protein
VSAFPLGKPARLLDFWRLLTLLGAGWHNPAINAPDVASTHLSPTVGPLHLTCYEQVNRRRVTYQPSGILVPDRYPRGGFASPRS